MATTTPNFGWAVPTSSDLVKNGATAIETLGDAIDASMVDLKGGTTGQVLAKQTNTDMDFTWSTPSAGSSNVAGKNFILNSGFNVWQRGTSFSAAANTSGYYADRWMCDTNPSQASTFSRQLTGDTTNLPNIQYCIRFQRNSGQTGTGVQQLVTSMETVNSIPLAGKTVTLSFYARAGANYSPTSNALVYRLLTGTGTDQNALTVGYTGLVNAINETATLTTTWQRFTATATIATNVTEAAVTFRYSPTGTAGANDYFEVTGVQLEIASSASAYSPNAATYQAELAACQRYYYRLTADGVRALSGGLVYTTTNSLTSLPFPVTMRIRPTGLEQSGTASNYSSMTSGTSLNNCTSVPAFDQGTTSSMAVIIGVASGLVVGNFTYLFGNSSAAYLGWSAEL